ncbi:MAG: PrsW family intramembrane metalloprotease, partial [Rhodobacteraceae bacterium]|nr:PrsW family intramembrane metalloprotease [Paracoccaceae bacterium]
MIIATALPLVVLYLIYRLDLYATGSFQLVMACFVWGIASLAMALFLANRLTLDWGWVNQQTLTRYVAPVSEELLKALFLIFLVRRAQFTYFVDGAIYGFAVGMGFAIIENALYLSKTPDVSLAMSRVISTNLMHATATSMVGIALGRARFHRAGGRFLWLLAGLATAIAIHAGFNNLVTRVNGRFLLLYAAAAG